MVLILAIAALGAELVRASCRRALLAPVRVDRPAGVPATSVATVSGAEAAA